ncbi:MAG: DUF4905 domain-containing protein [Ignavibacteria bacterium]|nr:DUF4905 domain-containing protein [Ignavibacteria bacterium]
MSIRVPSFFRKQKIVPAWQFHCDGILWRMKVSDNGLIIGEDRDTEKKTVSFFCIEEKRGTVLWSKLAFEESFWISVDCVVANTIFFHEFKSPSLPEKRKIYAVDARNGKLLWKNEELRFLCALHNCVYATKDTFASRTLVVLDIHSGTIIREFENENQQLDIITQDAEREQTYHYLQLPTVFSLNSIVSQERLHGLKKYFLSHRIIDEIEFFENDTFAIISYYENISESLLTPKLNQQLHIFNKQKSFKKVFSDLIAQNAIMVLHDSFYLKDNFLFFIKNKKVLTALNLYSPTT